MVPETILSGLVDYRPWARSYEGPYSRACKLGTLNVLRAGSLCRLLFGKGVLTTHAKPFHGRSLLAGAWLRETGKQHPLARSVAAGALDKLCGNWAQWIASDAQVRYCPDCMLVGFQSVVHQIDGLDTCPLHGTTIVDICQDCGHPLPPYAFTPESLDAPLCCSKCSSPFSSTWQPSALMACRSTPFDERPFALMQSWLRRLGNLAIEWPALSAWHPSHSTECPSIDTRRAIFSALTSLLPCPIRQERMALVGVLAHGPSSDRSNILLPALDKVATLCLRAIYKSIRRHVRRLLRKASPALFDGGVDMKLIDWNTLAPLPESQGKLTNVHAWLLWRKRFERESLPLDVRTHIDFALNGERRLILRPEVLSWPVGWAARPTEWGHFAWRCFLADWETARGWAGALAGLSPVGKGIPVKDSQRSAEAKFHEVYSVWASRLNPERCPWPRSLSQLAWTAPPNTARELVLVGTTLS